MNYDVIRPRLDCFRLDTVYLRPFALSCIELAFLPIRVLIYREALSRADCRRRLAEERPLNGRSAFSFFHICILSS